MRKPIPGFEGLYEVSDDGKVFSLSRVVYEKTGSPKPIKGKELSTRIDPCGYLSLTLSKNGKHYKFRSYQLVALAFLGPRPHGADVDHINRDKLDNRVENLRYASRSVNSFNADPCVKNTSGVRGVAFHKGSNKWRAYIRIDDTSIHLGLFERFEDAVECRRKAETQRVSYLLLEFEKKISKEKFLEFLKNA